MRRVANAAGVRLLAAAVALTLAACGGDPAPDAARATTSTTTSTTVARATWSEQLDEACAGLNDRYDQLVTADPASRAEAIAYAQDIEAFSTDLVRVLDDAGVPSEDQDDAQQLAALADELAVSARALVDAAQDGDTEAVATATEQLRSAGERINPLAESLDASACGGF